MNDVDEASGQATVHKRRIRISPVWLIPLAAVLIGCWLVYQNFLSRGPAITLQLDTAEGLQADKTLVKVRNVEVGHVTGVRLSDDYKNAIASIRMNPGTADLLSDDSSFWVVKPRIGRQGISGLGTILSGAYIQLRPGKGGGDATRHFKALKHPPVASGDTPGVSIMLTSNISNTLGVGDPVIFQGQTVGLIETAEFSPEHKRMRYRVFIRSPYSDIVSKATQFWVRSGIDMHIGADGIDVRTGSLQTIFTGGITFGLPDGVKPGRTVDDGAQFKLYATRHDAREDRFEDKIEYLVLLDQSVRGLQPGAPVLYRGIRIGTVKKVPYFTPHYNYSRKNDFRIPILIAIEPQRVRQWTDWSLDEWEDKLDSFFKYGLRISLKPANLLTGAMLMTLHYTHDDTSYEPQTIDGYTVFPSTSGSLDNIQQQISDLLDKFNNLNLAGVSDSLKQTLDSIRQTSRHLNLLLGINSPDEPVTTLRQTLDTLKKTMAAYQTGAPIHQDLEQALRQLNRILDNLEPMTKTLKNNPSALIFGPKNTPDPVPEAQP